MRNNNRLILDIRSLDRLIDIRWVEQTDHSMLFLSSLVLFFSSLFILFLLLLSHIYVIWCNRWICCYYCCCVVDIIIIIIVVVLFVVSATFYFCFCFYYYYFLFYVVCLLLFGFLFQKSVRSMNTNEYDRIRMSIVLFGIDRCISNVCKITMDVLTGMNTSKCIYALTYRCMYVCVYPVC